MTKMSDDDSKRIEHRPQLSSHQSSSHRESSQQHSSQWSSNIEDFSSHIPSFHSHSFERTSSGHPETTYQWTSQGDTKEITPEWSSHGGGLQEFGSGKWSSEQETSIQGESHESRTIISSHNESSHEDGINSRSRSHGTNGHNQRSTSHIEHEDSSPGGQDGLGHIFPHLHGSQDGEGSKGSDPHQNSGKTFQQTSQGGSQQRSSHHGDSMVDSAHHAKFGHGVSHQRSKFEGGSQHQGITRHTSQSGWKQSSSQEVSSQTARDILHQVESHKGKKQESLHRETRRDKDSVAESDAHQKHDNHGTTHSQSQQRVSSHSNQSAKESSSKQEFSSQRIEDILSQVESSKEDTSTEADGKYEDSTKDGSRQISHENKEESSSNSSESTAKNDQTSRIEKYQQIVDDAEAKQQAQQKDISSDEHRQTIGENLAQKAESMSSKFAAVVKDTLSTDESHAEVSHQKEGSGHDETKGSSNETTFGKVIGNIANFTGISSMDDRANQQSSTEKVYHDSSKSSNSTSRSKMDAQKEQNSSSTAERQDLSKVDQESQAVTTTDKDVKPIDQSRDATQSNETDGATSSEQPEIPKSETESDQVRSAEQTEPSNQPETESSKPDSTAQVSATPTQTDTVDQSTSSEPHADHPSSQDTVKAGSETPILSKPVHEIDQSDVQNDTYRARSPSVSEREPLLDDEHRTSAQESRPAKSTSPARSHTSKKSAQSNTRQSIPRPIMDRSRSPSPVSERTPLIAREEAEEPKKKPNRLPSFIALSILCVAVVVALVAGFAIPAIVQEYAKAALTFEPGTIAIEKFTDAGLQARVKGVFLLDADKVVNPSVRNIGRAATYIAYEIESYNSELSIYLPEYNDTLLGNATIPPIVLDIRNSHRNHIDMLVDVHPGDIAGIRDVAQDFMHGKETLDVAAVAVVSIKSGLFNLGTQTVKQLVKVDRGKGNKTTPDFDIKSLKIAEYGLPGQPSGIKAMAKVAAHNPYPIRFDVPSINLDILLPDCSNDYLRLGTMTTDVVHVVPGLIHAGATAFMSQLPTSLTTICPNSTKSPFDTLVSSYLEGTSPKIFIRGGEQSEDTPKWIGEMLKTVVQAPVPPMHHMDNMVKNFSLSHVHFALPATPQGSPVLSAIVNVVVGLPPNMTLKVGVSKVRADSDVYFEGQKMGRLDLREWQPSNSSKHGDELWVQSVVTNAPLQITDEDVFTKVVEAMVFGGKGVSLGIKALVDVETETALGEFVIRKIPSDGKIFIKPLSPGGFDQKVGKIEVVGSSPEELIMEAHVEVMNPTDYSADIPFFNATLWLNETRLGYAWGGFSVKPGLNALSMKASWFRGKVQSELLSQYISGYNTSMTIINPEMPGLPTLKTNITVPMPHMFGRFLKDTTMHILSSTATFVLFSPIPMIVTSIRSHAYHNGTDIGTIDYDKAFDVAVGDTETPRLPVDWNTNGGFGLIREALGGTLKLDARAETGVKIGEWEETIWYEAKGLGAKVRL